jgi:hypothetical protein
VRRGARRKKAPLDELDGTDYYSSDENTRHREAGKRGSSARGVQALRAGFARLFKRRLKPFKHGTYAEYYLLRMQEYAKKIEWSSWFGRELVG